MKEKRLKYLKKKKSIIQKPNPRLSQYEGLPKNLNRLPSPRKSVVKIPVNKNVPIIVKAQNLKKSASNNSRLSLKQNQFDQVPLLKENKSFLSTAQNPTFGHLELKGRHKIDRQYSGSQHNAFGSDLNDSHSVEESSLEKQDHVDEELGNSTGKIEIIEIEN